MENWWVKLRQKISIFVRSSFTIINFKFLQTYENQHKSGEILLEDQTLKMKV